MYGKIFESMYDGSLHGNWKAIVVFQAMISLCDSEGYLDVTPEALSARTTIPLDIIKEGISILLLPDGRSKSQDSNGRRIEFISNDRDWGYRIVNYTYYSRLKSKQEQRVIWKNKKSKQRKQSVQKCPQKSPYGDVDVNGDNKDTCAFDNFWLKYPKKQNKGYAKKVWKKLSPDEHLFLKIMATLALATTSEEWKDKQYIPQPSSWLNAEGWLNEYTPRVSKYAPPPKDYI